MSNKEQALTMLDKLYKGLNNRAGEIKRFGDYYDGIHPLRFASKQFEQYWGGLFKEFADNWAQVVVDSKAERLQVRGIRLGEGEADEETWRIWQVNGLDADSGLAIIDAIALGRAYALVWGDPDDDDTPMVTFESANEAIVGYESGSRRKRVGALKCWRDEDTGDEFATLYLPDEVWKFKRSRGRMLTASPTRSPTRSAWCRWSSSPTARGSRLSPPARSRTSSRCRTPSTSSGRTP